MAKVLDLRNSGGQLVIIGDSIAVPTSNSSTFAATSPRVAGSLRYNPDLNRIEFLSKDSLDWLHIGGVNEGDLSAYVQKAGDSISGNLTMTGTARLRSIDGTVGSPALTFASATSTGIALVSSAIVLSVGGTARVTVGTASTSFNNKIVSQDGDVSAPGVSFSSSANSGLYFSNGAVGLSSNGVSVLSFSSTAFTFANNLVPTVDNTHDIGAADKRWKEIHCVTFNGTATSAKYADLAERYQSDVPYEPGTVVVLGGDSEITISTTAIDETVAGVISTNPAFRMNEDAGDDIAYPFVALRGRVPCKVTGSVRKGDRLVTSDIPGHAMAAPREAPAWAVFAKAMEDFDGGQGVIEVLV
jgi:hypothetical protein